MKIDKLTACILAMWLVLTTFMPNAEGQTIAAAEYFIDEDPGVGNAIPLDAEDGLWDSNTETATRTVDTNGLSIGLHQAGIRFLDSEGTWSYTRRKWFYVTGVRILTGAEWFIDTDPGKGHGNPISLPDDGAWDEAEEEVIFENIDVSGLDVNDPNGHNMFVRFRDSDGCWGLIRKATFEVAPELYIAKAEWTTEPVWYPNTVHPMQLAEVNQPEVEISDSNINPNQFDWCSEPHPVIYVRAYDNLGRLSIRRGLDVNESGQWEFDPNLGWTEESKLQLNSTDVNCDRHIDFIDLKMFVDNWLRIEWGNICDFQGDGRVDFVDFAIFARDWRQ